MSMTLQDYLNQVRTLVHDTNSANFTDATLTNFINQARTRVAMDLHCVRGFLSITGGSALNTIAQKENYSYDGTVGGVTVVNGGSGYTAPVVSFTGGGGTGAAATASVIAGQIIAINMTNWGQGYGVAPTVIITDSTGTGATATSTALINLLDIISITSIWGSERIMHEWMPFGMFQTLARQYINNYNVPSLFTINKGIKQFFLFQIPDQAYNLELDIITLPTPLVLTTDVDSQVTAPADDAVQLFAAHLCMASLQNMSLADYWYSGNIQSPGKYDMRVRQIVATSFSHRIYNPYRTYAKRAKRM